MKMNIPFSPPYINDDVISEVVDSLKSGWITTGPKVKALEDLICEFSGSKRALCVNSWTSGAIMMLRWLGLKDGDEVIIPAYTYAATALAVIHAGGKPVMVDICDDFNISVTEIEKAITSRTKAIIPVDFAGYPCDYDKIMALVEAKKTIFKPTSKVQNIMGRVMVISDAAHSIGAFYKGKRTGSNADVVIFSLHAVKNVTTAEGGVICLNLPKDFDIDETYAELRIITLNCQTKDAFSKSKAGGWKYDILDLGMKINMPDINAALGLAQMKIYEELWSERKRIFKRYNDAFSKVDWIIVPPAENEKKESSYHLYAIRLKGRDELFRDRVIQTITKRGVAVNVHFIPMPMLTYFHSLGYRIENYSQAFENYKCEISLPIYPQLTDGQVDYVIKSVKESYEACI